MSSVYLKGFRWLVLIFSASFLQLNSAHATDTNLQQTVAPKPPLKGLLWTAAEGFDKPESVFFDKAANVYYVSNVVGKSDEKDGQGWIHKLDANGKLIAPKWVEGLNAPKGIRIYNGTLWVSDIDELVSIDTKTAQVVGRFKAEGAKFLNDVAVDDKGQVYVTDTFGNKIYVLKNGKMEVFVEGEQLEGPNGILVQGDHLVIASWGTPAPDWSTKVSGRIYSVNLKTKKISYITKSPLGNLDGLESLRSGKFLVSDWMAGKIYLVTQSGDSTLIESGMTGTADIGFNEKTQTLVVPRMGENQISAFSLSKILK